MDKKKPVAQRTGFIPRYADPHMRASRVHRMVSGATGLEPAISGLTGQRDNQLRYAPVSLLTECYYIGRLPLCQ